MDFVLAIGISGSLALVSGAAWPEQKLAMPWQSTKNWLLLVGTFIMMAYTLLSYFLQEGSIFFIFLQLLVVVASILMMLNFRDWVDLMIISVSGAILVAWSLYLSNGYQHILFILGLIGIAMGYVLRAGTWYRQGALMMGSVLVAAFSFIQENWVFFWLNVFFALFSGFYMIQICLKSRSR